LETKFKLRYIAQTAPHADAPRNWEKALLVLPPLFAVIAVINFVETDGFDAPLLIGDRTRAAFDLWSLQHFCGGVLLGALLMRTPVGSAPRRRFALFGALLALSWEAAELAMEAGLFGAAISHWKDGFEHWSNRLFGDPLMVTSGCLVARRFGHAWKIVLVPAGIWLLINVTSPSSMTIQRLLF
jgi:hypothetical protein